MDRLCIIAYWGSAALGPRALSALANFSQSDWVFNVPVFNAWGEAIPGMLGQQGR